ncbi:MAG: sigma-70 family RNA polymerase sigma factor [Verrucomicrobia bacterium]|nr:sigma-70 family RNA polymerase sigma factor [Verrucomicrobiota bacterium]
MHGEGAGNNRATSPHEGFATTRWSVVLAAAGQPGSPGADEALERLCRTYWYPLYAFIRRQGYAPEDAQDLTQAFFAHLLRRDFLRGVTPQKGRFRSFLLACLKHFLVDQWAKARTAKRGAEDTRRLMALEQAEGRYALESHAVADPEQLYERRWALDLLDRVLHRLRREAGTAERSTVFERLQGCLVGEPRGETYTQLGAELGRSETAVKVAVHRLRRRYRELLREEIAHTVSSAEEVESELRYLLGVVSR